MARPYYRRSQYATARMITAALCLSLCMVLPFLTGQIPELGRMMLPMHYGVFICAYLAGWKWAAAVGFIAPLMRSLIFGMPVMYPVAVGMAFELATYGLVAGLVNEKLEKTPGNIYVSLLAAMLCGRAVWGLVCIGLYGMGDNAFTWKMFLGTAFVQAIPGIIIQLLVIPPLVMALRKAGLTERLQGPEVRKKDVIKFFDERAGAWDAEMIKSQEIVDTILDNAGVTEGKTVLDVATGTGVLIEDYRKRKVAAVTAIDISPEMARICAQKYPEIRVICGDASEENYPEDYDCIVVYNAFPHFEDPEKLIEHLSSALRRGGTLTIAHGMSRERIDSHHFGTAQSVSSGLMPAEELAALMSEYLDVTFQISDERMYQVVGKSRKTE